MITFRKLLQKLQFWKRHEAISHQRDRTNSAESNTKIKELDFVDESDEPVQRGHTDSVTSGDASTYCIEEAPSPTHQVEAEESGHEPDVDEMSPSVNQSDEEEGTEEPDVNEALQAPHGDQSEETDSRDDPSDGISQLGNKPSSTYSVSDSVASTETQESDSSSYDEHPHARLPPESSRHIPTSSPKTTPKYEREEREFRNKSRCLNPIKTCLICDESKPLDDFAIINHPHSAKEMICVECMRMYLHTKIVTETTLDILCPLELCREAILYRHVQQYASEDDFALFDGLLLRCANEQDPMFRWCSNPECTAGQIIENYQHASYFTCPECHSQTCVDCLVPFHPGQTCARVKETSIATMEKASKVWLEENAKMCPRCSRWIQKINGCDHMTCRCHAEFCYKCGASYSKIRAQGNTAHERECPHYA